MPTEYVCRLTVLACHCNARLRPFTVASSTAKSICWALFVEASMHPPGCHHVFPTPHRLSTSLPQPMRSTLWIRSSYLGQGHHGSPSPALLPWLTWGRHRQPGHPITWSLQSCVFLGLWLSRVAHPQTGKLPTNFAHIESTNFHYKDWTKSLTALLLNVFKTNLTVFFINDLFSATMLSCEIHQNVLLWIKVVREMRSSKIING